jgi:hypothetical protein
MDYAAMSLLGLAAGKLLVVVHESQPAYLLHLLVFAPALTYLQDPAG